MNFTGVMLGSVAQTAQKLRELDQQDQTLNLRNRLAGVEEDKVKGERYKAFLSQAETSFKDLTALAATAKSNAADPSAIPTKTIDTLRSRIATTATLLSQIPGGPALGQTALDKFDATVQATPTQAEKATATGRAKAGEITSATTALQSAGLDSESAFLSAGGKRPDPITAQSDAGKTVLDRIRFVNQFGENSPQVKAFDEANNAPTPPKLTDVNGIRQQFTKQSSDFVTVRDAFGRMSAAVAGKAPTGASDIALIFGFMKMLDPGSVVREGEYATAQNSAGIPATVANVYNRALSGVQLTPEQRKNFIDQGENIFAVAVRNQRQLEDQFGGIAQREGIDPRNVVVDFLGDYRQATAAKAPSTGARLKADLSGKITGQ